MSLSEERQEYLKKLIVASDMAKRVEASDEFKWMKEIVFGALEDQAINTLLNAKTDEDRMKAQQMFLAARKPEQQIAYVISQGQAAIEEISTTQEEGV